MQEKSLDYRRNKVKKGLCAMSDDKARKVRYGGCKCAAALALAVVIGCVLWICLPPSFASGVVVSFDVKAERDFLCSAYYRERGDSPQGRVNA